MLSDRVTGNTTRQMRAAPQFAVFVWCNSRVQYAEDLARFLERKDLVIRSPGWLEVAERMRPPSAVVIDHAARLSARQLAAANWLRLRGAEVLWC